MKTRRMTGSSRRAGVSSARQILSESDKAPSQWSGAVSEQTVVPDARHTRIALILTLAMAPGSAIEGLLDDELAVHANGLVLALGIVTPGIVGHFVGRALVDWELGPTGAEVAIGAALFIGLYLAFELHETGISRFSVVLALIKVVSVILPFTRAAFLPPTTIDDQYH
jgi:hypothetical protein